MLKLWVGVCGVNLQIRKKKGAKIGRIEWWRSCCFHHLGVESDWIWVQLTLVLAYLGEKEMKWWRSCCLNRWERNGDAEAGGLDLVWSMENKEQR